MGIEIEKDNEGNSYVPVPVGSLSLMLSSLVRSI
jgi:hypothetical protein